MKRVLATCALMVGLAIPAFAVDHTPAEGSKKAKMNISEPVLAGDQALKPGEYEFQCKTIDGAHVMVISQKGKEVAKLPCTPETIARKAPNSEYRTRVVDGKKALSAILFDGEPTVHRVMPVPAS